MRPIFIPIAQKTDRNGAATFDAGLERTGDWRNIKAALQLPSGAEWALLKGGSPLTFGRGRRVTLGPELLEPFDTLQIQVTGGPPSSQILGSISGLAGAHDEIAPGFAPAPNTIALDTSAQSNLVATLTVPASGFTTFTAFNIPAGLRGLAFICDDKNAVTVSSIQGAQTSAFYFGGTVFAGVGSLISGYTVVTFTTDLSLLDSQVILTLLNTTGAQRKVWVLALNDIEAQAQVLQFPFVWQSPSTFAAINVSINSAASATLLAAPASGRNYLHGWSIGQDGANAAGRIQQLIGGTVAVECDTNATRQMNLSGDHKGMPTTGAVTILNGGGAASFIAASIDYAPGA